MAEPDKMEADQELLLNPEFSHLPIMALRVTSRKKLASFLDLDGNLVVLQNGQDIVNNYNGLAELADFDLHAILNLQRKESPTEAFLEQWNGRDATVGHLWAYLYQMERHDVLHGCKNAITRDCDKYLQNEELEREAMRFDAVQDPSVSNSEMRVDETKFSSTDDVATGQMTFYDAFICYTTEDENDRRFVREVIENLEVKRGLKLFVPGRNDIPGSAQHTINAYLIEKRCKRVVILMSKSFLKSQVCDFQVKFAHALAPGARSKRLIPIVREKGTVIPRILKFLAICDFTKPDMLDWVWDRLHAAIAAPVGPVTYFEEEDQHNPFKDLREINFPSGRRLDDEEEQQVRAQLSQSVSSNPSYPLQAAPPYSVTPSKSNRPVEHSFHSSSSETRSVPAGGGRRPVEHSLPSSNSRQISSTTPTEHFV